MISVAVSEVWMGTARCFYHYELSKIGAWLNVVRTRDDTCAGLAEEAF